MNRSARYLSELGRITFAVTDEELAQAYQQGTVRWKASRKTESPKFEIRASLAEIAMAKLCELSLEALKQKIIVQATTKSYGALLIPKQNEADKPYVLAFVDSIPYRIGGFSTGIEKLDTLIDQGKVPQYCRDIVFFGWLYGREVRDEHWFEGAAIEYIVPQEHMRKMGELAPGLFTLPETDSDIFDEVLTA